MPGKEKWKTTAALLVGLGLILLAMGAKWWDPRCPPCPEPPICKGEPCFMGQRCDDATGCLPRVTAKRTFSSDTRSLTLDVNGQGGVAVVGSFEQPSENDGQAATTQSLVARLAPDGEMKWSRSYGIIGAPDSADAVRISAAGAVWVAGTFQGNELAFEGLRIAGQGGDDIYVTKRMGGGRILWMKEIGTTGDDRILDLEVGEEENGYILTNEGTDDSFFLRRFLPSGEVAWTKQFPGDAPKMVLYRDDQMYLTANFTAQDIKVDWQKLSLAEGDRTGAWLARLDWDGDLVWARTLDGDGGGDARTIQDVAAMKDGDIMVSGFGSLTGFPDAAGTGMMYAARLSPAGTAEQLRRFGPSAEMDRAVHVSLTPASKDRVHVTGTCDGRFIWDGLRPRPDLEKGLFVGTLEADGAFGSAMVLPHPGSVVPIRARVDDGGKLYLITPVDGDYKLLTLEP
jgi:hypothetical protein